MKDLRLIDILDDGTIELTTRRIHEQMSERESAVQRATIALLNTAGTMVEAPTWGGSLNKLFMQLRKTPEGTRQMVKSVILQAKKSIVATEPTDTPWRIIDVRFISLERLSDRGYSVTVELDFAGAASEPIKIPDTNHASQ